MKCTYVGTVVRFRKVKKLEINDLLQVVGKIHTNTE